MLDLVAKMVARDDNRGAYGQSLRRVAGWNGIGQEINQEGGVCLLTFTGQKGFVKYKAPTPPIDAEEGQLNHRELV